MRVLLLGGPNDKTIADLHDDAVLPETLDTKPPSNARYVRLRILGLSTEGESVGYYVFDQTSAAAGRRPVTHASTAGGAGTA